MPHAELRLIKRCAEFRAINDLYDIPPNTRGIYVLYRHRPRINRFDVVYIGMARGLKTGIKGRLIRHKKHKTLKWTHFSLFEVWDNISPEEVSELEGIFRHIYRRDSKGMKLNLQKGYKKMMKVRVNELNGW